MSSSNRRQKTRVILRSILGDSCYWCGKPMAFVKLGRPFKDIENMATIEHHLAKEAGDKSFVPNLRLAHKRCNI